MTLTYGFYDSLAGDRKYTATQMSSLFNGIITDGVFATIGTNLVVTAAGGSMNISVGVGRAWFNSTWTNNDSILVLAVPASETVLHRIDRVILEVDTSIGVRANSIKILKGTPASTPVAPTLATGPTLFQYALANIAVNATVTQVLQSNVTNMIGTTGTPWIGGAVSTIDASIVYTKLETQFSTWFNNLVNQLSGAQITNLQAQINVEYSNNLGWVSLPSNLSFVSVDGPIAVINGNTDITGIVSRGMRLRYEQAQALTAYWNMDANSNSQVGSFNGTDTAMTYSAAKFSNGAVFNGTTSKIIIADNASLKPTGEFTYGLWFKTSNTGAIKDLFQSFSANANIAGIKLQVTANNVLRCLTANNTGTIAGTNYTDIFGSTVVTDNALHYAVVTFRNNYMQLYLDGALEGSCYAMNPAYAATNYVRLGCGNATGTDVQFMNGTIDDVFFINGYALDERTIRLKYRANAAQGSASLTLTKYAEIHDVGSYNGGVTPLTVYGGTDFTTVNASISNPYYSNVQTPFGYNRNPDKWSVFISNVANCSKATPTTAIWYGDTGLSANGPSIVVPIGVWEGYYKAVLQATDTTVTDYNIFSTLSNNAAAESDSDNTSFLALTVPVGTYKIFNVVTVLVKIKASVKTPYYLNLKTTSPTADTIQIRGDVVPTIIKLTSSYL